MDVVYSWFPQIRNHFFRYILLFSNNSLFFYLLFYVKVEMFLIQRVSCSRETAVLQYSKNSNSRFQVIPSHGNPQMRWTLFDCYLFKYCSVKYQTFHQVSEETSQQTYSHQKTTWKALQMPPRAIKHELTRPNELTSGSFLIGRRGISDVPRNRLVVQGTTYPSMTSTSCSL